MKLHVTPLMLAFLISAFAIIYVISMSACGPGGSLLSAVKVTPDTISPNGDGQSDVASMSYHIGRPATLSIMVVDSNGKTCPFRQDEPRSAGSYEAKFSGVCESTLALTPYYTVTQASVLPDGAYKVIIEAQDKDGHKETAEAGLTIMTNKGGGDAAAPGFGDFSVFTPSFDEKYQAGRGDKIIFTPNRDGIGDRVAVSYWLSNNATVEVYLIKTDDSAHSKYPISQVSRLKPGRHEHDYEGGVDLGNTPPPNGEYLVVGEATDAIGNRAVIVRPLTIADGGVPLAQIISSSITPVTVPLGGMLRIEMVVQNMGTVTIRSAGPYSGTVYTTDQNYNTLGFPESPGVFRVGADYEGNSAGRIYPFRWGFANDRLLPGERQTVIGYVRITTLPTAPALYFWTGLVHEQVRVVNDKVAPVKISIGF